MGTGGAVLVLDDDPDVLKAVRMTLTPEQMLVEAATSPDVLQAALRAQPFDTVLLDMNFSAGEVSGRAGMDGLAFVQGFDPNLSVVLMTAYGGVALAVEALKRGAVDFVLKPWRNDKLVDAVKAAVALTRSKREAASLDLDLIERHAIERALARHDGNISKAAEALGLTRPALYRRIEKHGL
jgi:DNA-binding NtrC family response regulator